MNLSKEDIQIGLDQSCLVDFDKNALMDEACSRTGLDDFGDDGYIEPLTLLASDLVNAQFTDIGRRLKTQEIIIWLENRLKLQECFRCHPEIENINVESPIFITGMPRSGTSILFELMSLQARLRSPSQINAQYPWASIKCVAEKSNKTAEEQLLQHERLILASSVIRPELKVKHETGPDIPAECVYFTAPSFRSALCPGGGQTPGLMEWFATADKAPEYDFHKKWLQLLEWRSPGKRWLLKGPAHLGHMAHVFNTYPDAVIVQTHRDPLKVIPSLASLANTIHDVYYDAEFNIDEFFQGYAVALEVGLMGMMAARDNNSDYNKNTIDVLYGKFMENPVDALAGVYRQIGIDLSNEDNIAAVTYLDKKPKNKFGKHTYRDIPDESKPSLRENFKPYMEKYGVVGEG